MSPIAVLEAPFVSKRITAYAPADRSTSTFADIEFAPVLWEASYHFFDRGPEILEIDSLEIGYLVLRPIVVEIRRTDDKTFTASFDEANIAIAGADAQDAYQSLVAEILDVFDALSSEVALSPFAKQQLSVLETYIVKA